MLQSLRLTFYLKAKFLTRLVFLSFIWLVSAKLVSSSVGLLARHFLLVLYYFVAGSLESALEAFYACAIILTLDLDRSFLVSQQFDVLFEV